MPGLKRITIEQPATITYTWVPQDSESPADPDGQATTVAVTHVSGTVIVASAPATRVDVGQYSVVIPPQSVPADMIVSWSALFGGQAASAKTYVTALGAHLVDLSEIRVLDGLQDTNVYPTTLLAEKRDDAETLFEAVTGKFWTPHYVRDVLDGDPNYRIALQSAIRDVIDYIPYKRLVLSQRRPRQLLSITLAGTAAALSDTNGNPNYLVYSSGELEASFGTPAFPRGMENVVVEYVAGEDAPPSDLRQALRKYIRYLILDSNARIPDRATAMTTEFGTFRIGQANAWDNPTGLSEVDSVLQRYGERIPAFA